MSRKYVAPHDLDQGWLATIKRLGDGAVRTPWGLYEEVEVDLAAAGAVSPRIVRSYAVEMIEGLGLKPKVAEMLRRKGLDVRPG